MARVLVVDDSAVMRAHIIEWLEEAEYEIVGEAETGEEGVEKFKELRPEITTLDITMPVKCGISALEEIMEIDPETHVLMVSSEGNKDGNIPKTLLMGAVEFVEKPLEKELFLKTMANIKKRLPT